MAALLMATLGVWCAWNTVGEYVLEHRIVTGRAEGARVVRGTRSPNTYQVIIDRQGYNITRDLLAKSPDRGPPGRSSDGEGWTQDFQSCVHLSTLSRRCFTVIRLIGRMECDFGCCEGAQSPKSTRLTLAVDVV
jgi:hypothetical protein